MEYKEIIKNSYYHDTTGMLLKGNCLEIMKDFPDKSIDMILCDLPYEITKNKWDTIIPFEPLWNQYNRIIKNNGAIVLFADGLFMANLMLSNQKMWRYNLIWDKVLTSGFLNSNRMPLRKHEEVCVFYKHLPTYNPQKTIGEKSHSKGSPKKNANNNYGEYQFVDNSDSHGDMKFPTSIQTFTKKHPSKMLHPTEKSVEHLEYLIKTYTNESEIVLDNAAGSCTTTIAAKNTNRRWICIEQEEKYCDVSVERIKNQIKC